MPLVVLPMGLHRLGLDAPTEPALFDEAPVLAAENISIRTKDLVSLTVGADPIDQQVQTALSVLRASGAAVTRDGQRFLDVRKLDDTAPVLLEQEARTALGRLTRNGDIVIEAIGVVRDSAGQWGEVVVDYVNNRLPSSKRQQIRVPIRAEAKGS